MPQTTGGGVAPIEPTINPRPSPPVPAPVVRPPEQQERFADQVMIAANRQNEIYKSAVSPTAAYHLPDTSFWAAGVQNDEVLTAATAQATEFFATIYGGENLAAYMNSLLISDPIQRERTIAALSSLRGIEYTPVSPGTYYRPTPDDAAQMAAGIPTTATPEELMLQFLDKVNKDGVPAALAFLNTMSAGDKAKVAGISDELAAALQDLPDTGMAAQLNQAIAYAVNGDFTAAFTPSEVEALRSIPEHLEGLKLGGSTSDLDEAPSALAQVGIDQVRKMGEGVFVLDMDEARTNPAQAFAVKMFLEQEYPELEIQYGREGVLGSVLGLFGQAVDYISAPVGAGLQQVSELAERVGRTAEDKAEMLANADKLEEMVRTGNFYNVETGEAIEATDETVNQAIRVAARLRETATDDVGWQAFEEQVVRNTAPRALGFGFAESATRAADIMPGDPEYALTYAVTGLAANIVFDPLNYIIPGIGALKASRTIPKIPYVEGMLGSVDEIAEGLRLRDPALSVARSVAAAERRLEEARSTGFLIQEVGRSWIKNGVYRALAKTPEELAATRPFMRASQRLWRLRERLGKDEFGVVLAEYFGIKPGLTGGDTFIAKHLADAVDVDDMGLSVMNAMNGHAISPMNVDKLVDRMNKVTAELDSARLLDEVPGVKSMSKLTLDEWDDLITARAHLDDLLIGRDWTRPLRGVLTPKRLRQLERLAGQPFGPQGQVLYWASEFVEKFPGNILNLAPRALFKYADDVPGGQQTSHQFMVKLENMYKETGTGDLLTFPHTSAYVGGGTKGAVIRTVNGKILEDSVEESFASITNIARFMGLPKKRIRELMAPWIAGDLSTANRSYEWWKSTWQTMVDESPYLTAMGKQELRTMWHSLISERSPGFITAQTTGGLPAFEPTIFRQVTDPLTGEITPAGVPAFEADQFQVWRTPTLADLRAHMSTLQRTMTDWRTAGAGKKALSMTHLGLSEAWAAINQTWRTTTLGFRLFGALPARIGMEQMLRIAAYDYASAVWHPLEWFTSTSLGVRIDDLTDVALFTDSPVNLLGTMVRDLEANPNYYLARAGRTSVRAADGAPFYRAYSERIGKLYASPSVNQWHLPHLGDTEATLVAMREGRYADRAREWLTLYDDIGMDPAVAVARTQQEITELIGTGPGADKVRAALRTGRVEVNGEVVRVGTANFADWLEGMAKRGEWAPPKGMFLNRAAGDYLPVGRIPAMAQLRDRLFNIFYTAPDLAMSRSPLFRQIAAREFRNLMRRGYSSENALGLARAYAARETADLLFTIGAKTSGEYFLKNLNPFFPAFRELASTWLKRVPLRVGEGHWALGAAAIARRGDVWIDFFKNIGAIRTDEQGSMYLPIPGLQQAIALLTGANIANAPLESFAGILPVPTSLFERDEQGNLLPLSQRTKGIFPTLGGPASVGLGLLSDIFKGSFLEGVEDFATLYGTDQSLGPMAVDRFFEAFNVYLPWMTGTTRDAHEAMKAFAVADGIRLAQRDNPPPLMSDFDSDQDGNLTTAEQAAWGKASTAWIEDVVTSGEMYARKTYLIRGLTSMTLPFSVNISDEGKEDMRVMWDFINSMPDEGLESPIISAFLAEYPFLQAYMAGKTQDMRTADDPEETVDERMQAMRDGAIKWRKPYDYAVFSMGMNAFSVYQSHLNAIYEGAGETAAERLVNFDAKEQLQEEYERWQTFLDLSEQRELWPRDENGVILQSVSFKEMYDTMLQLQQIRDGDVPRLSTQQQKFLDFNRAMKEMAKYFSPNPESSSEYYKLVGEAFDALGPAEGTINEGISWWYTNVADPYYAARDKLYNKLDTLDRLDPKDKAKRAAVYDDIRKLADEYNKPWVHDEYGDFPTPEEYVFIKLSEKDQDIQIAEWAKLPGTFLTEFQRSKVGYSIPDAKQKAASELAEFVSKGDRLFDNYLAKNNLSANTTAMVQWRAQFDAAYADKAEELGLKKYWHEVNAPIYTRIGKALNISERTKTWDWAVTKAEQFAKQIADAEYGSVTSTRETVYDRMASAVSVARKTDPEFDSILNQLSVALSSDEEPLTNDDLVRVLFFDVYQP